LAAPGTVTAARRANSSCRRRGLFIGSFPKRRGELHEWRLATR
jgi:hypothetical protein